MPGILLNQPRNNEAHYFVIEKLCIISRNWHKFARLRFVLLWNTALSSGEQSLHTYLELLRFHCMQNYEIGKWPYIGDMCFFYGNFNGKYVDSISTGNPGFASSTVILVPHKLPINLFYPYCLCVELSSWKPISHFVLQLVQVWCVLLPLSNI